MLRIVQYKLIKVTAKSNKPVVIVIVEWILMYEWEMLLKVVLIDFRVNSIEFLLLKLADMLFNGFAMATQKLS